ncbi:thioredoxin [Opisthorchis viverrini]|uniref:Thioredoxin n=1 Tax=Opisthorchis viverrini TaxID=6198 RepID=A0A1S8X0K8_OPIVI|nr:thioredoxin [Opisthorchis viverrini]
MHREVGGHTELAEDSFGAESAGEDSKDTDVKVEFLLCIEEKKDLLIVVEFYADWCPPCRLISPIFANMEVEFPDAVFFKINADNNEELVKEYNINSLPTFIFMRDGKVIREISGSDEQALRDAIANYG